MMPPDALRSWPAPILWRGPHVANALAPLDLLWLEDRSSDTHLDAHLAVRAAIPIALCVGRDPAATPPAAVAPARASRPVPRPL